MTIRLLFACFFSLVLLGLIPYLNRGRTAKELPIVSYRLHSFETKIAPEPIQEIQEKTEEKLERSVAISAMIPRPALVPIQMNIPTTINTNLKFEFSNFTGTSTIVSTERTSSEIVGAEKLVVQEAVALEDNDDHLLFAPKPIVPLRAIQLGLSGSVKAQFDVNEKGAVENITILKISHPIYEKSVLAALKQYRFKPYTDSKGNPIKTSKIKEFQFE